MPRGRWMALSLVTVLLAGSLGVNLGYAWYLRSERYRRSCASYLSATLGLPSEIGGVVPRSHTAREFDQVVVWLPDRRGRALTCRRAIVRRRPTPDDPQAYEIDLLGGTCEISARTWLRSDYRSVLNSGLRPGFAPNGPRRVTFGDMDVRFARDGFAAELQDAGGRVDFESRTRGRATAVCRSFNGYRTDKPVVLAAEFSPAGGGVRIDSLVLEVPTVPLRAAWLKTPAGLPLERGSFSGRLAYRERDSGQTLMLSGRCSDLDLSEFTAGLRPNPWRGTCPDVQLRELRFENGRPMRLRFAGRLRDVRVGDILATFGLTGVPGTADLHVADAVLSRRGLERLEASGRCQGVSLEALSAAIGLGRMSGTLTVRIDDLRVEENRLAALDATLRVEDAGGAPNWIETALLREVVRRAFGLELPRFLPERIEYSRLGVRLFVRDEDLYVFGTHGEKEDTILSARLLEQEVPLVRAPRRRFDLTPVLDVVRQRVRRTWDRRGPFGAAASQPTGP